MTSHRSLLSVCLTIFVFAALSASEEPSVHVDGMESVGPRAVEKQTQASVIRDYLRSWQTMDDSLAKNQTDALNGSFVGQAKDKLAATIREQQKLGIAARYQDKSHRIKVVFYSPEGLSIQLVDDVEYEVEIRDRDQSLGSQHVRTRYIAVLTPTESKWKVRLLQGGVE